MKKKKFVYRRVAVTDKTSKEISDDGLMRLLANNGIDTKKPIANLRPIDRKVTIYYNRWAVEDYITLSESGGLPEIDEVLV